MNSTTVAGKVMYEGKVILLFLMGYVNIMQRRLGVDFLLKCEQYVDTGAVIPVGAAKFGCYSDTVANLKHCAIIILEHFQMRRSGFRGLSGPTHIISCLFHTAQVMWISARVRGNSLVMWKNLRYAQNFLLSAMMFDQIAMRSLPSLLLRDLMDRQNYIISEASPARPENKALPSLVLFPPKLTNCPIDTLCLRPSFSHEF